MTQIPQLYTDFSEWALAQSTQFEETEYEKAERSAKALKTEIFFNRIGLQPNP
jgi:hypothetical protein